MPTRKAKGLPTKQEIVDAWNMFEGAEPDISTERLFAMVCDHFQHRIDNGDVAEALHEAHGGKNVK